MADRGMPDHAPRLHLCLNCLQPGAVPYPIGPETGSQRDPYRATVDMCSECAAALQAGDFEAIHERFTNSRSVGR